jgi:hypothetical protein
MIPFTAYTNKPVNGSCPKCGAPRVVKTTSTRIPGGEEVNLHNFVGCTNYARTGCNYKAPFTESIKAEIDALPVEMEVDF